MKNRGGHLGSGLKLFIRIGGPREKIMLIPKCKNCGQEMIFLSEIAASCPYEENHVLVSHFLYQCPEDKTIAVD